MRFEGDGREIGTTCGGGGAGEELIVLAAVVVALCANCLCCRMIDGRFFCIIVLGVDLEIGSAGKGGGGSGVVARRFGEERELGNEGGTEDIKPLRRSEVEDLKDPAMEFTTEGLRLRLMGRETSGSACICPWACFRVDVVRSGFKKLEEPAVENVIDSE